MKKLLIALACVAATVMVSGQGTIDVRNKATGPNGSVDAPIFDVDGITKLGSSFLAQVYAGPAGNIAPIGTAVPFRDGAGAGYYNAGADFLLPVPGVALGGTAEIQVRAWEAAAGTYAAAAASTTFKFGSSTTFSLATGGAGSPAALPSALVGLTSFSVGLNAIPEPSTMVLGLLGAAALLIRRRK